MTLPFRLLAVLSISLASPVVYSANLIVNGDFSGGALGFQSQYFDTPDAVNCPLYPTAMNEKCYSVTNDPTTTHGAFASFGDHPTGTGAGLGGPPTAGKMLVANGAQTPDYVWQQTVNGVAASTKYGFSAWAASAYNANPANLLMQVDTAAACNGSNTFATIGTINATTTVGEWVQNRGAFSSGASTAICVRILNQNIIANGNDFVIDDISLDVDAFSPTATADTAATPPNTPVTIDVLSNDAPGNPATDAATIDLDPSTPGIQSTYTVAGQGTFTVNAGKVDFTPVNGFNGVVTASYRVSATNAPPGLGAPSNVVSITVTVGSTGLAAGATSVPTLSQWGLVLMSGLLGLFGLARIRRRD